MKFKKCAIIFTMLVCVGIPVSATEIIIPDEVIKMEPTEAYKKGYTDALNASTKLTNSRSNSSDNSDKEHIASIEEVLDFKTFEIEILRTEEIDLSVAKDGIGTSIVYSFKNKGDKNISASEAVRFIVFQNDVEQSQYYISMTGSTEENAVKPGGFTDRCTLNIATVPEDGKITIEITPSSYSVNTENEKIKYIVDLQN